MLELGSIKKNIKMNINNNEQLIKYVKLYIFTINKYILLKKEILNETYDFPFELNDFPTEPNDFPTETNDFPVELTDFIDKPTDFPTKQNDFIFGQVDKSTNNFFEKRTFDTSSIFTKNNHFSNAANESISSINLSDCSFDDTDDKTDKSDNSSTHSNSSETVSEYDFKEDVDTVNKLDAFMAKTMITFNRERQSKGNIFIQKKLIQM